MRTSDARTRVEDKGPDLTSGNTNNLAGGDNLQFTSLSGVTNFEWTITIDKGSSDGI